jgi:NAD-dependent dihydropyrimidine dehydrogenase PreA subunit
VSVLASVFRNDGYDVTVEPDLCKKMMQPSTDVEDLASSIILACYPRAIHSLFHKFGIVPHQTLDIRNHDTQDIFARLNVSFSGQGDVPGKEAAEKEIQSFAVETGTDAWYPVIDKDRCSECRQCHDFCLFGVYEIEEGEVKVKQPQNCKNNCPACARICPSKAVIFPKYEKSPINGGLEDEEIVSVDMKAVYADALRTRLQQRRASVSLLKK